MSTVNTEFVQRLLISLKNAIIYSPSLSEKIDGIFEEADKILLENQVDTKRSQLTTMDKQPDCPCGRATPCTPNCPHEFDLKTGKVCFWCMEHYKDVEGYS